MKKILFIVFIALSVFTYSNSKCEFKARYAAQMIAQNLKDQGLNAQYNFIGQNKENKDLYLYEVLISLDGETAKMFVASNVKNGTVYVAESETNPDFKVISTDVKEVMCKN